MFLIFNSLQKYICSTLINLKYITIFQKINTFQSGTLVQTSKKILKRNFQFFIGTKFSKKIYLKIIYKRYKMIQKVVVTSLFVHQNFQTLYYN